MTSAKSSPLHWLIRGFVYISAAWSFSYITADPDLWGHIKFGGETWTLGRLPGTDTYSYTAFGQPWINHEWLTEIIFFLIYTVLDSTGLLAFKALLGIGIVHLMSKLYFDREHNLAAYLIFFVLMIPVMAPGFMTRPHLMTFLFLSLFVAILQKYFDGNERAIFWTPLLMLAWVNCHGGVLAGMGLFGVVTGIEVLRTIAKKDSKGKPLLIAYALCWLAVMLNPYGYKLWVFFYHSLGTGRAIGEWEAIPIWSSHLWTLKTLTLIFIVSLFLPTKKRLWEIALIAVAIYYGFKHQRHSVMIPIVMAPYLPMQISQMLRGWDFMPGFNRLSRGFKIAAYSVIIIFIGGYTYNLVSKYAGNNFKILVEPVAYPTHAAQFMIANNIKGNILVPFDWGEYIIWKMPESKVSVDGRFRTVYPEEVLQQSLALSAGHELGKEIITRYPTEIILTNRRESAGPIIESIPAWRKIYIDKVSDIYIHDTHPFWEKFNRNEVIRPDDPPPFNFPG